MNPFRIRMWGRVRIFLGHEFILNLENSYKLANANLLRPWGCIFWIKNCPVKNVPHFNMSTHTSRNSYFPAKLFYINNAYF